MNSLRDQNYKNKNTEKKIIGIYHCLTNYVPGIVKNTMGCFKDKIMTLLKTNTTDNYSKPTRAKNMYKGQKIIKTIEDKIISDTRNFIKRLLKNRKSRHIL